MTSPIMSFSPSYSPIPQQNKMFSPRYNGGKTDYTNRNTSPLYNRNNMNSPVYQDIYMRQTPSPYP